MFKQPKIIVQHELMGPLEVVMSFSSNKKTIDGEFEPRHIALVKTKVKPKYDKYGKFQEFTNRFGGNISCLIWDTKEVVQVKAKQIYAGNTNNLIKE